MSELEREFEFHEAGLVVTEEGLCEFFPDCLDTLPMRVYGILNLTEQKAVFIETITVDDLEFHYDVVDTRKI